MKSVQRDLICTLFEGDYHKGLVALINSLYKAGFHGDFYAGYKGELPSWQNNLNSNKRLNSQFKVHFLQLDTSYHLTNYKPDFILKVINLQKEEWNSIYYLDPDIVVQAPWDFMREWVSYGVALCEDVNSPLPEYHPKRCAWRKYFGEGGHKLKFKDSVYVNGGFVGLVREDLDFINIWRQLQEEMSVAIGGLDGANMGKGKQLNADLSSPLSPFSKTDQDALNATLEAYSGKCSLMGKEAMGFKAGYNILPHALGQPKPWDKRFLQSLLLNGVKPSLADKAFWEVPETPIVLNSESYRFLKKFDIKVSSFISRFYSS